jgi:hypothetical protein
LKTKRQYRAGDGLPFIRKQYLIRREQDEALKRWHKLTSDPPVDLVRRAIDEMLATEERRLGVKRRKMR